MCLIMKVTLYTGVNVFHLDYHLFSWQSLVMTIVTYSTYTLTTYFSEAQRKVAEHQRCDEVAPGWLGIDAQPRLHNCPGSPILIMFMFLLQLIPLLQSHKVASHSTPPPPHSLYSGQYTVHCEGWG